MMSDLRGKSRTDSSLPIPSIKQPALPSSILPFILFLGIIPISFHSHESKADNFYFSSEYLLMFSVESIINYVLALLPSNCKTRQNDRCLSYPFQLLRKRRLPPSATCCDPEFDFLCSENTISCILFVGCSHFASPFGSVAQANPNLNRYFSF